MNYQIKWKGFHPDKKYFKINWVKLCMKHME